MSDLTEADDREVILEPQQRVQGPKPMAGPSHEFRAVNGHFIPIPSSCPYLERERSVAGSLLRLRTNKATTVEEERTTIEDEREAWGVEEKKTEKPE